MARKSAIRRGLTIGLAAAVGAAIVRAARTRRAATNPDSGPTWPPLPQPLVPPPLVPQPPVRPPTPPGDALALVHATDTSGHPDVPVNSEVSDLDVSDLDVSDLEEPAIWSNPPILHDTAGDAREAERESALTRFAAQRTEAKRLLLVLPDEPDTTPPTQADQAPEEVSAHTVVALDDPLWPLTVNEPDDPRPGPDPLDGISLPALEPEVPDNAVADLEEEPAWAGSSSSTEQTAPQYEWPTVPKHETTDPPEEPAGGQDAVAAPVVGLPPSDAWEAWRAANPASWATQVTTEPADEAEPEWESVTKPTGAVRRRPLMTGDFDDALAEDQFDDENDVETLPSSPSAALPLRRSGRPRVPLKARRLSGDDQAANERGMAASDLIWVEPVGSICPSTFPVKAIFSRRIFHVFGGRSYARTQPERCYRSADDAQADGMRQAKR